MIELEGKGAGPNSRVLWLSFWAEVWGPPSTSTLALWLRSWRRLRGISSRAARGALQVHYNSLYRQDGRPLR